MGVRVDLALWIYREHFAALALVGVLVAVARATSRLVLGPYALPATLVVSAAALAMTAGLVWCVARSEPPRTRAVLRALWRPLHTPGRALKALTLAALRARVQLVVLMAAALTLDVVVREGVGALAESAGLLGEWSELTRTWVACLGAGMLEPVLYVATALWLFELED